MMPQRELFTGEHNEYAYQPCDPSVPSEDRPRLSRQCQTILERLRRGPATNDDLSAIARKYTSRTSDLRKAGYVIECFKQDHVTGVCWYRLNE